MPFDHYRLKLLAITRDQSWFYNNTRYLRNKEKYENASTDFEAKSAGVMEIAKNLEKEIEESFLEIYEKLSTERIKQIETMITELKDKIKTIENEVKE